MEPLICLSQEVKEDGWGSGTMDVNYTPVSLVLHFFVRRGRGFVDSWMGMIQENTFRGAEDLDLWIFGWG